MTKGMVLVIGDEELPFWVKVPVKIHERTDSKTLKIQWLASRTLSSPQIRNFYRQQFVASKGVSSDIK